MSMPKTMKPMFWSAFGAGGMIAALILPTIIFVFSFLMPWGFLGNIEHFHKNYAHILHNGFFYFVLAGVLFIMLWHCVHRFYYCLHDCQIHVGTKTRFALYAFAIFAFIVTLAQRF